MALQGDAIELKNKDQRCSKGDVVESLLNEAWWRSRIKTEPESGECYMVAKTKMTRVRRNEFIRSGDRCDSFVLIGAAVTETVLCVLTEHRSSVLRLLQSYQVLFQERQTVKD